MSLENSVSSADVVPPTDAGTARILRRFARPTAPQGHTKIELGMVVRIIVLFLANALPATN